jgi:hypothetical protein
MLTNQEIDAQIDAEIAAVALMSDEQKQALLDEFDRDFDKQEKLLAAMGFPTIGEIITQSYADEGITIDIFDDEILGPAIMSSFDVWKEKPLDEKMAELIAFYHDENNLESEASYFDRFED